MSFQQQEYRDKLVKIVGKARSINERLDIKLKINQSVKNDNNNINNSRLKNNPRLKEWCQLVAQGNWEKFENFLTWKGIDLRIACSILDSENIEEIQELPAWAETLNDCLSTIISVPLETLKQEILGNKNFEDTDEIFPFEEVFLPFIYVARKKLIAQVNSHYHLLSDETHATLERSLLWLTG
jgi:hypothetical protein